jgi:hypothetical protein
MAGRGKPRSIGAALAAALALALLAPGAASAQVTAPEVILGGHLYPKPYGDTYVYGRLRVPDSQPPSDVVGQTVALYASSFPFTAWAPVATLTTDWEGYFSFHTTIGQNMSYRAIWQAAAPVQSKDKLVKLPLKLSLRASHTKVKKRGVVTFAGAARPAHPGARVELQQMDRHGGFRTVSSTVASQTSAFSVRLRVRRGGVFRVLFPGDGQFGAAASRPTRVQTR